MTKNEYCFECGKKEVNDLYLGFEVCEKCYKKLNLKEVQDAINEVKKWNKKPNF